MTDRGYTEAYQIISGELRKEFAVNVIGLERWP